MKRLKISSLYVFIVIGVIASGAVFLLTVFLRPATEKRPSPPASKIIAPPHPPTEIKEASFPGDENKIISPPTGEKAARAKQPPEVNLRLLGTIVRKNDDSKALIENLDTGTRKFYRPGEKIAGVMILEIRPEEIILESEGRRLTLRLSSRETSAAPSPPEAEAAAQEIGNKYIERWTKKKSLSAQGIKHEIKNYLDELNRFWTIIHGPEEENWSGEMSFPDTRKVAENTWEVGEDDALRAIRNARRLFSEVNLSPHSPVGDSSSADGFRLKILRDDSVWKKMGFQTGDVITRVNDRPIRNLADLIPAARSAQSQGTARITVIRDSQPVVLHYYMAR